MPRFYRIFKTGLSDQSHKQHGCHASAISGYTLAEQKISKQQLKFHFLGYIYDALEHNKLISSKSGPGFGWILKIDIWCIPTVDTCELCIASRD